MTLQQLEYIIALDIYRHFGKAAKHCKVAQPSLSIQIQKLEQELNTSIFIRTKTPITLTETGILIIEQARKIIADCENLKQLIQLQNNTIEGNLKIGIIPTLAPYLLPLFLMQFIKLHPAVSLNIIELTTDKIIKRLKNGLLDIGILATPLSEKGLQETILFNEEFVAYVSKKESIYRKKYLLQTDIDVNKMWLLEEGHCLRNQSINLCELQKNASIQKHLDYESGSIETLKKFVEKNEGLTLLPELATIDMSIGKKAMLRYFKSPAPVREISMVTSINFTKPRLANILKECIIEYLPQEVSAKKNIKRINIDL